MSWPAPQDYNEALQSPQLSFSDSELKSGQVETDKLGLPRPIAGGFAIVYKIKCGGKSYAVRCFQREVPDQQDRYAAISAHLNQVHLPYTVVFQYQAQGIRIRSQWYPIVKMEWIEGLPLSVYIKQKLYDSAALLALAASWMKMTDDLHRASIAHGDLQDGNVLVINGAVKLIDYDGMFVPQLAGRNCSEGGHRHYQHPQRSGSDFELYLDNFSSWVIYVSIIALAIDPTLWSDANARDECLLFRQSDYKNAKQSFVLSALEKHHDHRLQALSTIFLSLLSLSPQQIPALSTNMATGQVQSPMPVSYPLQQTITSAPASGSSWIEDHVQLAPKSQSTQSSSTAQPQQIAPRTAHPIATANPSWILDFINPPIIRKRFASPIIVPRAIMAVLFGLAVLIGVLRYAVVGLICEPLIAAMIVFVPIYFYGRDEVVKEGARLFAEVKAQQAKLLELENIAKAISVAVSAANLDESKERAALEGQRKSKAQQIDNETRTAKDKFDRAITSLNDQINGCAQPAQQLQNAYNASATRLSQQVAQLNNQHSTEIATTLAAIQKQYVLDALKTYRIDHARIHGIGAQMAANLRYHGHVTAFDISWNVQQVPGIGNAKTSALMVWRQQMEAMARHAMPKALSSAQLAAVDAKYHPHKQSLAQQVQTERQQFDQQYAALTARSAQSIAALNSGKNREQQQYQGELTKLKSRVDQLQKWFDERSYVITAKYRKQQADLDAQASDIRRKIFDQNWAVAKAKQEASSFSNVTFMRYIIYLFTGSGQ